MRKEYFKFGGNKSHNKNNNKSEENRSKKNILIISYKVLYIIPKYALLAKLLFKPFFTIKNIAK